MEHHHLVAQVGNIRIAYRECLPPHGQKPKGTVLLIHGFPQTSYQFRHVLPEIAIQGYRCLAPDYRGAGHSSKTGSDFTKTTMAADLVRYLQVLDIQDPIHLVGHDVGGMIAFAMATRHRQLFKTVCWGECPLPGTAAYYKDITENAVQQFHFIFHCVEDLPEVLIQGKERAYVSHFFHKITFNLNAFSEDDIDLYVKAYAQPGAIRCAAATYRAFGTDAEANVAWIQKYGKCCVPTLVLSGRESRHREEAEQMALEVTQSDKLEVGVVDGAAHYLAEENPSGFAERLLAFIAKHQ